MQKALDKNPASIQLKLAQLELCKDIWDSDKVTNAWKDFVFRHPNNPVIWLHYLTFVESRFRSFTVSGALKVYAKCLQTLKQLQEGTIKSHEAHPHTPQYMIGTNISVAHELCYIT